jgi:hypothetical protein
MVGGRFQVIPQKSQAEKFVESVYALSILLLLVMAISALYITNIILTNPYPNYITLEGIFITLYKSSFFAILIAVLVIGYGQGRYFRRHRLFVKLTRMIMVIFVVLAFLTYTFARLSQPIQAAFFVFLSLIEVFVLEIHNMAFSVPAN